MDSSSDDGSKNKQATETNWSLSSFVKPDPKPVEKFLSQSVPQITVESTEEFAHLSTKKKSCTSPKCLTREQMKQEFIGN